MHLDRSIISLAILKVNWDEKKYDFIEIFVPFIATLLLKNRYKEVSVEKICTDFEDEYGLHIPVEPMTTILTRCKKRGLIRRLGHLHLPVWEKIVDIDFSATSESIQKEFDFLLNEIRDAIKLKFGKFIELDIILSILIDFLKQHDGEILFTTHGISVLPEVKTSKQDKYFVFKIIQDIILPDPQKSKYIINIAIGHILANTITYGKNITRFNGKLKNLTIYLDIKFLIRLTGIEGDNRKDIVIEFIKGVKEKGATIKIFQHTYEETLGIINGSKIWLKNKSYNPNKANLATKYFVENGLDESDIDLHIARLRTTLASFEIAVEESPDPLEYSRYIVNEDNLYDKIVNVYSKDNTFFREEEKEFTILKDIKSISSIYLLRKNNKPHYIKDAHFLFVTANNSLAYASFIFEKENSENDYTIPVCVTNVFLGTTIWLDNPVKLIKFNEKKIIADCYAALKPNEKLIKKYILQIERLNTEGKISDDEYYFLRTFRTSYKILEDITLGYEDNFTERTPFEILKILREEGKLENKKEIEDIRKRNEETLITLEEYRKQLEHNNLKIENISNTIAKIFSWLFFIILIITFIGFLITKLFINQNNTLVNIFLGLVTIFSVIYGITFKNIKSKIYYYLYNKIKKFFLRNDNKVTQANNGS